MDGPPNICVRRQFLAGAALAFGGIVLGTRDALAAVEEIVVTKGAPEDSKTSLHQEVLFTAPPRRIYEILLSSKEFAAMTKLPADISPDAGGEIGRAHV